MDSPLAMTLYVEFIDFMENAEVSRFHFSSKYSSSKRAAVDDESYEFSSFCHFTCNARDAGRGVGLGNMEE
jgi:hypothetical protein